jgi:hypothetical protein
VPRRPTRGCGDSRQSISDFSGLRLESWLSAYS